MSQELDFNKLVRLGADKDRESSLQLGVYRGMASIAIFQGQGAPKVKIPLGNRMSAYVIPAYLKQLKENANPDFKVSLPITKFNPDTKKRDQVATVVFARDDKNVPFIGVSAPGINPVKFPIRVPLDFDLSQMTIVDQSKLALDAFIDVFTRHVPVAMALTSFKREFNGNRGGGNYGGGNAGGNQNAGGQGGGKPTGDDEIVF